MLLAQPEENVMKKNLLFGIGFSMVLFMIFALAPTAQAGTAQQNDDIIERGRYLASIAGCTHCHTPLLSEFSNPATLTIERIRILAFEDHLAFDWDKWMGGGRVFDLGPAGVVFTRNITPDVETGIGGWTDEQLKVAIRTGQMPSGEVLFPLMPYHNYNGFADADLEAIIAYMRSVTPVKNEVPPKTVSTQMFQPIPYRQGITAPDASDKAARGKYLVEVVMGCTDCHTPLNPETGAPMMDKYLAGGQPYEGPWGVVYGGNITPDNETGLGDWTEADMKRAIVSGVGKDGRRLILMPWYAYSGLNEQDAEAVTYYMKYVLPPVRNEIPAPSVVPDFVVMSEEQTASPAGNDLPAIGIMAGVGLALILLAALYMRFRNQKAPTAAG
jgi:mono/diheme cytochrome c family protein